MRLARPVNLRLVCSAFLLLAALAVGGSASRPGFEMALAAIALGCLLVDVWHGTPRSGAWIAAWIIGLVVAVPVLQLAPLPERLWALLPQGRFVATLPPQVAENMAWRALSMVPDDTLYSLLAALPACVMLWLVAGLSNGERLLLANIFIAAVMAMAVLGIVQAVTGAGVGLYDYAHLGVATGLFASRNNYADLILMGAAVLLGVRATWLGYFGRGVAEALVHSGLLVLLGAMVASASRTGTVLFLATALSGYLLSTPRGRRGRMAAGAVAMAGAVWLALTQLPQTGFVKTLADRFAIIEEGRWEIWRNCLQAIHAYMPWGAGLGTFRSAYEQVEPLRSITPAYVNAAHNEYLQLLIECGLIGAAAALSVIALVLFGLVRNRRSLLVPFAGIGLAAVLLHSIDDYPFRVIAGNVTIAFLCGLVVSGSVRRPRGRIGRPD